MLLIGLGSKIDNRPSKVACVNCRVGQEKLVCALLDTLQVHHHCLFWAGCLSPVVPRPVAEGLQAGLWVADGAVVGVELGEPAAERKRRGRQASRLP